jgi:GR25 family glycosyltransferase involved in LPS biosynthesis
MIAFVMNLETRPERWKKMKKDFLNSGIRLKRFVGKKLEVGLCGTLDSTVKILKEAKEMKLKNVLILEDDCKLQKGWKDNWKIIKEWLDDNLDKWDIYSGGNTNVYFPKEVARLNKNISLYDPIFSTASHWIYISEINYNKIIKHYSTILKVCNTMGRVIHPITSDIYNNFLKTLISYPYLSYQYESMSDTVHHIRTSHRKKFINSEKYLKKINKTRKL